MRPRTIRRYKRAFQDERFYVLSLLFSLDAIMKPIPLGTILFTVGEYGVRRSERYIRTRRKIKIKHSTVWLDEWVKRRDLLNPALTKRLTTEQQKALEAERYRLLVYDLRKLVTTYRKSNIKPS